MVQARSYPGGSAFPTDADLFCLFDRFRLWVVFPLVEVLYADFRVATADRQYIPDNRFLWFGYRLSAQMDGLNVTLPCCGLVSFDVSESCWCGEFYREALDRRNHVGLLHQRSSDNGIVSRWLIHYQEIGRHRRGVFSLANGNR